ncbi:hypothetical protein [Streptomyces sp. NPDC088725]|uniref:hypothetical protein n=1 Tax=Streptomyces sp. NPDC088725 TaxID=3365873 RepID=UPI003818716C
MKGRPAEEHWSDSGISASGHVETVYAEMTPEHSAAYAAVMEHAEECPSCDAQLPCKAGKNLRRALREARQ